MEGASPYAWDDACMSATSQYLTSREIDFFHRVLRPVRGGLALDIGCGAGKFVHVLEGLGYSAVGLEYDRTPLSIFLQRDPAAKVVQSDGQHLPFQSEAFDVVSAVQVQDYFQDRAAFFGDVWRVLRPGGLFLVTMTNRNSLKGLIYKRYLAYKNRRAVARFYERTLSECLDELLAFPFAVDHVWGYNWNMLPRDCDNAPLVRMCGAVERGLGLERLPQYSPLVFVAARKVA